MELYQQKTTYKRKSFMSQIIFYGLITILCIVFFIWIGALFFALLTALNIWFHIRNKDKYDPNILKQEIYQHKSKRKAVKEAEKERKKQYALFLEKIDEEFNDEDLDRELAALEDEEDDYPDED